MRRIESGRTNPTILTLKKISDGLEVSLEELVKITEKKKKWYSSLRIFVFMNEERITWGLPLNIKDSEKHLIINIPNKKIELIQFHCETTQIVDQYTLSFFIDDTEIETIHPESTNQNIKYVFDLNKEFEIPVGLRFFIKVETKNKEIPFDTYIVYHYI